MIPDKIDAGNMNIDIMRHRESMHLPQKMRTAVDHLHRHYSVFQDKLVTIDVFEKKIKGLKPLFDARFDIGPFCCRDDSGDDIKGKYLFDPFAAAINGKGDPLAHKKSLGKLFFFVELLDTHLLQEFDDAFILWAHRKGG